MEASTFQDLGQPKELENESHNRAGVFMAPSSIKKGSEEQTAFDPAKAGNHCESKPMVAQCSEMGRDNA